MLSNELAICEEHGTLPDAIYDQNGDLVTDFVLAASEYSDLLWDKWQQKIFIANNTGSSVLILIGRRGCTVGNRTCILADNQNMVIGYEYTHLVKTLSILPLAEATLYSESGTKNLTVEGWEAKRGVRDV